ncbi:LLM class flavin-dependent oxidoreductase [Nonomuraea sp. NPDC050310]|uniref:LLM class flavin-dependent oxidoreductase n=1 Tax=Nonomuraea sp. NPDC050310 TaxID=3154935 RepID=UPI0034041FC8
MAPQPPELEFHIVLPTRSRRGRRFAAALTDPRRAAGPHDHVAQVARAAELAGLSGAVLPFDPGGAESFVLAGAVLRRTRYLRVTAEFHPAVATPVYAAKLSLSLARFSADRLDWKLADLDPVLARAHGDFLDGPERFRRAAEFLTIAKGVWSGGGFSFRGRHFEVLDGGFGEPPLAGHPLPRVVLSGTSPEELDLSAEHGDVHLFDPWDDIEAATERLPGLRYGVRLRIAAREDAAEAAGLDGDLTGGYEGVAAALREFARRGVTVFHLEAAPALEETYRIGEHLLPLLAKEDAGVR